VVKYFEAPLKVQKGQSREGVEIGAEFTTFELYSNVHAKDQVGATYKARYSNDGILVDSMLKEKDGNPKKESKGEGP